jgi:hypothetical protein
LSTNQIEFLFEDNPDPVEGPVLQEEGLLVLNHLHGIWKKINLGTQSNTGNITDSFEVIGLG